MMRKITADYIFPVSQPPIKNGVVIIDEGGKVLSVDERKNYDDVELEIYNGIIVPGFINAHCHLEGSHLKGRIAEKTGIVQFILDYISKREAPLEVILQAVADGDAEMKRNGIVGVGDISNKTDTFLQKTKSDIQYHTFVEVFGFNPKQAEEYFNDALKVIEEGKKLGLQISMTPHAPYSVPAPLFEKIVSYNKNALYSYHNQESKAEDELFVSGIGNFKNLFIKFNLPDEWFKPTGKSSLVSTLRYFEKGKKILFVHNSFTTASDIDFAVKSGNDVWWCSCPNANLYIENTLPDYDLFLNNSDRVVLGTDSLASNYQLSILEEMKIISLHKHNIDFATLIQWATLNGARFFGWENVLGSIDPGKQSGLNLIENIDSVKIKLTPQSSVQKIA
jgi:aminodeoxyfutalosine deaminase